jgi:hypothetical protein
VLARGGLVFSFLWMASVCGRQIWGHDDGFMLGAAKAKKVIKP